MAKHYGSFEIRKDLRVEGKIQSPLELSGDIKASAFYLSGGGEFSSEATTLARKDDSGPPVRAYSGPGGLLYAYDPTRDKYLSVSRTVEPFGRNDLTASDGEALNFAGVAVLNTQGVVMPRSGTITSITGLCRTISTAELELNVKALDKSAAETTLSTLNFYLGENLEPKYKDNVNADFEKGDRLTVELNSAGGGEANRPYIHVEYAWRDDT